MKIGWVFLCAVGCFGQAAEGYVESVFRRQVGELPRLGWFSPVHGFVTQESKAAELVVLGPLGTGGIGARIGTLIVRALDRRKDQIACGQEVDDSLGVYRVEGANGAGRALYLSRKMRGAVQSGLVTIPLDTAALAKVNQLLGWPATGVLRRDEAWGVAVHSYFFSRHRLYDSKTGLLRQEALLLHRADGETVAHEVRRGIDKGDRCDSCAPPSFAAADSGDFRVLQMFVLPDFAYPVLLLDSSTFENEGRTLLTVTPAGKVARFVVSEYMMHCG